MKNSISYFSLFLLLSAFSSCTKDKAKPHAPPPDIYFFSFEENGKKTSYSGRDGKSNPAFLNTWGSGHCGNSDIRLFVGSYIQVTQYSGLPAYTVSFKKIVANNLLNTDLNRYNKFSDFTEVFALGKKEFCLVENDFTNEGIIISYRDSVNEWSTIKKICNSGATILNTDYSKSNFIINEMSKILTTLDTDSSVLINATFNCTLYNCTGDSMVLTNGHIKAPIRQFK